MEETMKMARPRVKQALGRNVLLSGMPGEHLVAVCLGDGPVGKCFQWAENTKNIKN